jgi:putative FmdB family regulatory protein
MPVFEYTCNACNEHFELLVLKATKAACPACSSENVEKQFSLPAVKSDTTRDLALRAAKRRDAKIGTERVQAQIEYERNHD